MNNIESDSYLAPTDTDNIKIVQVSLGGGDEEEKLLTEENSLEEKGRPSNDLNKIALEKKKVCICSRITHEVEEEQVEEIEMAEDLPEKVIETTPVLVDPSAEVDLETLLKEGEKDDKNTLDNQLVEETTSEPEVIVTVSSSEIIVEKNEIGVGTEDLDYTNEMEKENEILRNKLMSLSRSELDMSFKETQTDFVAQNNDAINFDVDAERAKIQEMLTKFTGQQLNNADLDNGGATEIQQPMQIEFEIAFDFSQDPSNPNVTLLKTSSVLKDIDNSSSVNQIMSVEMNDGMKVENEANSTSIEQEIQLPASDEKLNETNVSNTSENENLNSNDASSNEEELQMVEVCDAFTSMGDFQESSFEEKELIEQNATDPLINTTLKEEEYIEEKIKFGWSQNQEQNEQMNNNCVESCFQESYHCIPIPMLESEKEPLLPKCLFRELDSVVRSIAEVYSHYEGFVGKQLVPSLARSGM